MCGQRKKKPCSFRNAASFRVGSPSKLKARTFRGVFTFPNVKKKHKAKQSKRSRTYRNPIALAREWQKTLRNGNSSCPADLGRKLGVSRARVTQVLRLLSLAPEVLKAIVALGDPLPSPIVSERRLRPIVKRPAEDQRQMINTFLAGRSPNPPSAISGFPHSHELRCSPKSAKT